MKTVRSSAGWCIVLLWILGMAALVSIRSPRAELERHLAKAAADGNTVLIREYLDLGIDPNALLVWKDINDHQRPIVLATQSGNEEAVALLLEAGADPEVYTDGWGTPLMIAAERGDERIVRLLLSAGADPNAVDNRYMTPILYAARSGCCGTISALIDAGADPLHESLERKAAAVIAREEGHEAAFRLLRSGGRRIVRN